MFAVRILPILFLFLFPVLLSAQPVEREVNEDTVRLQVSPAMVFGGRKEALMWSEDTGFFEVRATKKFEGADTQSIMKHQVEIRGRWLTSGAFGLDEFTILDEPRVPPPVEFTDPWLSETRFGRVSFEGVIQRCIDRGYLMEIILETKGRMVGVLFVNGLPKLREEIQPGRRIEVTGYRWAPSATRTPVVEFISCPMLGIKPLPFSGEEPPLAFVEYTGMEYRGLTSSGEYLFVRSEPPLAIRLSLDSLRLMDWGFEKKHLFTLGLKPNPPAKNGVIRGQAIRVIDTRKEVALATPQPMDLAKKPMVGSTVNFQGLLAKQHLQPNGDMWLTVNDRDEGKVKVICKSFKQVWPGLKPSQKNFAEVRGLYQGDTDKGLPEIVVRNRGDLYLPQTGRNWTPILFMLGGLMLSLLWVTMLRRLVRDRTREARESEANLMAVYQSVPIGIVAVDPQQQIFGINPALSTMFGLPQTFEHGPFASLCDAIGGTISDPEAWRSFVAMPQRAKRKGEFTVSELGRSVKTRSIEVQVEPIVDDEKGEIWLFRDLSEQRDLERSLAQSRKLEAVGRLTGGIAHDFNNLLTGVTGNLSMLEVELHSGASTADLAEYVQGASTAADHAAQLVRTLLDYSKQSLLKVRNVSANDILMNLYGLIRHSMDARIQLDIEPADELLATQVDPLKIEQVVMNLVINAIDAMPDGGRIQVSTANTRLENGKAAVTIYVTDNGSGIPVEVLDKIFDPYFTTKAQDGNGLGLPSALAIVEQHGGKLLCHSTPGEGTRFEVILPANHEPCEPFNELSLDRVPQERAPNASTRKPSVVAIDDQPNVLRLVRGMLARLGCEVVCFPNGREALDHIHKVDGAVDLVVSDNSMPVMDGMQTYKELRAMYPDIPFIVCSGYLIDLDDYGQFANGILPDAFIEKPLRLESFTEVVQGVLAVAAKDKPAAPTR